MNDTPIMIMTLIDRYVSDPTLKDQLPEFDFIWKLGQSVKDKGCYCGINQHVTIITPEFNQFVENLSPELAAKAAAVLKKEKLCFGIINVKDRRFEIKCY